ncbi:phage tail domain-containing protein [Streptomyces sp. NPDC051445]|uniref:phage tail domain-containing protein n=1 Tax=Streptomyces sp. NPDC051445 TaxID=3365653 RepID=UPI0037AC7B89
MPIPVRPRVVTRPVVSYVVPPVPEKWGRTNVSVIGRNGEGEELFLTGFHDAAWPSIIMQPGATGLDMPPYALFSDESPNLDGSIYRSSRAAAREIMIPVYLYGIDRPSVNQIKRKLFQSLNPKRGYCLIKFTEGNNQTRVLKAYYKGGMEGSESTDTAGFTWAKYGLTFTAMDPWFYPDRMNSSRWDFGQGDAFLSATAAFFPLRISPGVMGAGSNLIIDNPGDVEAWPIWELHGPIKSFTLTSPYGETVKASPPTDGSDLVPSDRILTIDTRPGHKTVKDDLGTNYWSKLDANPEFWSVEPGETSTTVNVVTGAGKAAVVLSFFPRYASFV